jgi:tRNA/rRNA methyltransferase
MNRCEPLSRIRIVLSRPSHPGNIGAAARAMRTMGVSRLYLVAPRSFPHDDAVARAAGATDVLDNAVVCDDLAQALAGTVVAAGFTARKRDLSAPAKWLRDAAPELMAHAAEGDVALVFGNETAGLSNEDLSLCRLNVMIPTADDYSSLNLGAAVQLACYELRLAVLDPGDTPQGMSFAPARFEDVEGMIGHLQRAMTASGFLDPANPQRLMPRLRRLFNRTGLEREEVNILRGMVRSFRPDVD